ncbi:hypothetical protein TREMEDRAFT_65124 [Tremella mesenterica DSM 1558]|uniref:uncharacterized protein n=1 Tax=Tremella mesenterica (strain ATCC 24925 / CBS 8224 / DSM 1558 / NBRC 9311 / NRRL Y-6157 / RJB 2259-6 / UBC 559-6) TaxID=578456 RepID=UPI00032D5B26|nr:uncharacterized protein TREMEDRAFT_65124 [Tremella mesenterica DSM 1558]EIW66730.1 hypothetical protein TREMEDRAFT_65124 [Tremella mesenterica DSM 1558]
MVQRGRENLGLRKKKGCVGGKDSRVKGDKEGPKCWNCGQGGHMKKYCPKKEDEDEGKVKGKGKWERQAWEARLEDFEIGAIGKDNSSTPSSIPEFLVDSGCTHHVSPYIHLFTNPKKLTSPAHFSVPNGGKIVALSNKELSFSVYPDR